MSKKTASLMFFMAVLLMGGAEAVRGQSPLDGFDPNANGVIRVVVVQPNGKILIGGDFTALSPNGGAAVTRNRIARLNADGTLDTFFNPNANGAVYAIALQRDGNILAGGAFNGANSIGGQTRNRIARLDPTTGAADFFNPNASGNVFSIAVQPDERILVGGAFTSIGGATRNRIARFNPASSLADSFNPNANGVVYAITVQADGKILTGGAFSGANSIGGQTRNRIVRLDAATGLADAFDPNANGIVRSIAFQADGKILAGGEFNGANSIGGQPRNYIARLDATTGVADSFNPNAGDEVFSIAVQPDGRILAGGLFMTIGGQTRNRIARLDATTGLADSFDPDATSQVLSIAVEADGKILAGGFFDTLSPNGGAAVMRNRLARLETDGSLDRTLDLNIIGPVVNATAVQPDGKFLIGGRFTSVLGVTRNNIARVNRDGTLDAAFNPNANDTVYAIAVQADGRILACGQFTSIGGETRNRIARLDAATGLADSFNPNANYTVFSIAVQADGKILAAGNFFEGYGVPTIGGQTRNYIARLDPTTGLADSFNPNAAHDVHTIAVQADGRILAGGTFTATGGQARNGIARLDATTGAADSFNPNATGPGGLGGGAYGVYAIAIQADGKVLVGGAFTTIGGQTRNRIARLDPTTGAADSIDPNASASVYGIAVQADGKILLGGDFFYLDQPAVVRPYIGRINPTTGYADSFNFASGAPSDPVRSIALQADGKVLVGGFFSDYGSQPRNCFARLSNRDPLSTAVAAVQNLSVTPTLITWTRGGPSPLLTGATFEVSTDNVNYTFLGHSTAASTTWVLSGFSLPTGQNIYIRARGFYRSGRGNSSESITESVRNAFIAATPQPLLKIQRSANTNVVLSWATNFIGFTLEANTNLNPNVWSAVSPAPVASGTNNVVTNAASSSTRFYRLRKP